MPPVARKTADIEAKVARRQFFACTRALPIRASHSWRARRYGVSSGPSGLHWCVIGPALRGGFQAPALGAGPAGGDALPIALKTSDGSAAGGAPADAPRGEPLAPGVA